MAKSKKKRTPKVEKPKKDNALDIMKQIKAAEIKRKMDAEKKVEIKKVESAPKDERIDFDIWWMSRSPLIPKQHRKEIIRADFIGRGLGNKEKKETYDAALEKYGLKIKR